VSFLQVCKISFEGPGIVGCRSGSLLRIKAILVEGESQASTAEAVGAIGRYL
jgi:hypothetical protein